jgi:O-antigen/teichoic acid export membrane protein
VVSHGRHERSGPPRDNRTAHLLLGRIAEQGSLGLTTILAARYLPVDEFAAASVVLVVNSIALAVADLGLSYTILARPPDQAVASRSLHLVRSWGLAIAVVGASVGLIVGGRWGLATATAAFIWPLAAEARLRASTALRASRTASLSAAQLLGACLLLGATVLAVRPGNGVIVIGLALGGKHLVEIIIPRGWSSAFSRHGAAVRSGPVWGTQMAATAAANLDYVVAGLVLGEVGLAVYLLAFRVASVAPSLIANVAVRRTLVDLVVLDRAGQIKHFVSTTKQLFVLGALTAGVTAAGSPLLSLAVGDGYPGLNQVLLVVVVATPFRMVAGQAGSLAIAQARAPELLRVEIVRAGSLVLATLLGGLAFGLAGLVGASSLATIGSTVALHYWVARDRAPSYWQVLPMAGVVAAGCAMLLSFTIPSLP